MRKLLILLLASSFCVHATAQQTVLLSKNAQGVKRKVEGLAPQAHISLVRVDAEEEFGNFLSGDQEALTFYDVDSRRNVTVRYEDVKKIKHGYGGYNQLRGKHVDPTARRLGIFIIVALLGTVIGLAAGLKS